MTAPRATAHFTLRVQPAEFVAAIRKPRAIIILVQAGKPVDDTLTLLAQYLEVRPAVAVAHAHEHAHVQCNWRRRVCAAG